MLAFLDVVDARSFTAAAERLGRTKSALSQAVSRLEQDIGCRLLHRSTRSLSLTENGAQLLAHCREIKQVYEAARSDLASDDERPKGTLSITAPHILCALVISPCIAEFARQNPDLSFRLVAEDASVDLIERQIDLSVRIGQPHHQTPRISKIGTLKESLFASERYLADKSAQHVDFERLGAFDHIANEWQGTPVTYRISGNRVLRVAPRFRCNSAQDALRLTREGAGIARLPDFAAAWAEGSDGLVRLFPLASSPIYAVHQFANRPPSKVTGFIRFLRHRLKTWTLSDQIV